MYIDVFFLVNLVMDRLALECAVGRLRLPKGRLWLGAFVGAMGACVWEVCISIDWLQPIGAMLLSIIMVYACVGRRPWKQWCSILMQVYVYGFLFAGVIPYVSRYIPLWTASVLLSYGGIKLWLYLQSKGKKQFMIVRIENEGEIVKGKGIVDTGHLLKEPITGRPVIIVKKTAVPEKWKASWPLVYQSVKGKGLMYGFWPQRMWIGEQLYKEKEIMVAAAEEWNEKEFLAIIPGYLLK
ncbi:MAG: sigma-E processing peptidase SpoIIGA [Firmicutes bacterium]|nr:sigma-E processing peptidase SpoIIGA [Bacillota bacterium]